VSLLQRTYFAVAASGANELDVESGDCYSFLPTADPTSEAFELSPVGKAIAELGKPDARKFGEPYTPVAVLFEHAHGELKLSSSIAYSQR
jgi:hypothetical protein